MFSSFSGVCCYGKYFLKLTENNQKRQRMLFALEKRKSLSAIPLCSHPPFLCATSTTTTLTSTLPPPNHHCPHSHTSFTAAITNPLVPPPQPPPTTISTTTVPTGNINERSLQGCNQTKENKSCDTQIVLIDWISVKCVGNWVCAKTHMW